MYFNRARNYDPNIGRFIQPDPHNGYLKLPRTVINKYIYSLNNPTNFRDPSGANLFEDFVNGIANTGAATINGLGKAVEGFFQGLGDLLSSEEIRIALIVAASFYTGGLAGAAVGGGMMGAAVGAVVGGITGAAVGGIHAQVSGDDPGMWMRKGFQIGMAVGSISGYTKGFGMFENAGDPALLASNATQGGGLSAECYSAAATYYNVVAGGEYLNSFSTILMGPWRKGASWGGKLMKYSGEHYFRPRMEEACLV